MASLPFTNPFDNPKTPIKTPDWDPVLEVRKKRTGTLDLVTPTPLPDNMYTLERVVERARYASSRLTSTTRYVPPTSAKLLTVYEKLCMDFLLFEANPDVHDGGSAGWFGGERAKTIKDLQNWEDYIRTSYFLRDVSHQELVEDLVKFRRAAYWAQYGDYAAHLVHQLRAIAKLPPQTPFADTISGQNLWTKISAELTSEQSQWKKDGSRYPDLVMTTVTVWENCRRASLDFDRTVYLIHMYANRNEAFHEGLKEALEAADYNWIAHAIHSDLNNLSSVCGPNMMEDELAMRAVLQQLRDDWFIRDDGPNIPGAWNHTKALVDAHHALKQKKAVQQNTMAQVARKAAQRLGLDLENEDLPVQAATSHSGLPPPGPGPHLKAKAQHKAQPIDVSDRQMVWDTIVQMQKCQYTQVQVTLAKQREINRLVSAYRNAYGDDKPPGAP